MKRILLLVAALFLVACEQTEQQQALSGEPEQPSFVPVEVEHLLGSWKNTSSATCGALDGLDGTPGMGITVCTCGARQIPYEMTFHNDGTAAWSWDLEPVEVSGNTVTFVDTQLSATVVLHGDGTASANFGGGCSAVFEHQ